jgi:transcriptional regulator with XRE-family HTH domain
MMLAMFVGDRLRAIREERRLSQGDIEKRTGLLRCYISRVENGQTVPSLQTLEKFAGALEVPLYRLFYEGKKDPKPLKLLNHKTLSVKLWGSAGKDARTFNGLRLFLGQMEESDRRLLLYLARKMGGRRAIEKKSSRK